MAGHDNGLKATLAAIERLKTAGAEAAVTAMVKGAHEIAATQHHLAPKDTGALAESIKVTLPGQTTPRYSQPGGQRVAGEHEVIITAGDEEVRYAHLVEHGSSRSEALPFFFPGYRLHAEKVKRAIDAAFRRRVRREWGLK